MTMTAAEQLGISESVYRVISLLTIGTARDMILTDARGVIDLKKVDEVIKALVETQQDPADALAVWMGIGAMTFSAMTRIIQRYPPLFLEEVIESQKLLEPDIVLATELMREPEFDPEDVILRHLYSVISATAQPEDIKSADWYQERMGSMFDGQFSSHPHEVALALLAGGKAQARKLIEHVRAAYEPNHDASNQD